MSHEFNDTEMMPCDICGEFWPGDGMIELENGTVCCPDCTEENSSTEVA